MWLIVFGSKFLILWIDEMIFGKFVELGRFWSILIISLVLMLSEKASRALFKRLGKDKPFCGIFDPLVRRLEKMECLPPDSKEKEDDISVRP